MLGGGFTRADVMDMTIEERKYHLLLFEKELAERKNRNSAASAQPGRGRKR